MAEPTMRIKYIDRRPIFIPKLKNHPGGVALPSGESVIQVTESEYKNLMKMKNGPNPCFTDVRQPRRQAEPKEE